MYLPVFFCVFFWGGVIFMLPHVTGLCSVSGLSSTHHTHVYAVDGPGSCLRFWSHYTERRSENSPTCPTHRHSYLENGFLGHRMRIHPLSCQIGIFPNCFYQFTCALASYEGLGCSSRLQTFDDLSAFSFSQSGDGTGVSCYDLHFLDCK